MSKFKINKRVIYKLDKNFVKLHTRSVNNFFRENQVLEIS